ncbi:tRNA pseudouridine(55) synthase TruB [Candidatus Nomurabacteria bacterium]|nr:tRNA pseudouridine(55) synthase TruB [Candidatus Nomurabacteria bacterium]
MEMPELLLIDKPKGITSFDVIRRLRKEYSETHEGARAPKMGHAGTLDPLASGLMLIGFGSGTKKLHELIKLDKEYVADILVGERRSTGDMEGEVLEEKSVEEHFSDEQLSSVLASMVGTLTLPVSAYSAIKKDGVPMYKRARAAEKKGELIEDVPVRNMTVHEAELLNNDVSTIYRTNGQKKLLIKVRFKVESGTYIRSLAEEFGKRLGYPATIKELRRTKVGEFRVEDAFMLER